ncbi:MAG: CtsR family transcriptional regulator [Clostridia bacterium]|nr:CtsR family transcriptional regulator [Clostridia bacterium]
MAKVSDLIEEIIKEMMDENDGFAEITRGALAEMVNCVPSQVTYVLSTRFTNGQGYRVESRRGGGGSIRIYKIDLQNDLTGYIMHVVNSMGVALSQQQADVFIRNFVDYKIIDAGTARLMATAMSDSALEDIEPVLRGKVRMKILKNLLIELIINS